MNLRYLISQPDILNSICSNLLADDLLSLKLSLDFRNNYGFVLKYALPISDKEQRVTQLKPINALNVELYSLLKRNNFSSRSTLLYLIRRYSYSKENLITALLKAGADPNTRNNGNPILLIAVERGDFNTVDLLLKFGVDIDTPFGFGLTPLLEVSKKKEGGHAIERLLDRGANINHQTEGGKTALIFAIEFHRPLNVKILIERGIDLTVIDGLGHTILDTLAIYTAPGALPKYLSWLKVEFEQIEQLVRKKLAEQ